MTTLREAAQRLIDLQDMDKVEIIRQFGHKDDWLIACRHARDILRAALAERDNYAESASLLAQAVVLAEREKCAQLVETYEKAGNTMNAPEYVMVFKDCAAAIRARGRQ